jgi:hypothetical protein
MRRDQASTPPNPDSDMVAKVIKSSARLGRRGAGDTGLGTMVADGAGGCGLGDSEVIGFV